MNSMADNGGRPDSQDSSPRSEDDSGGHMTNTNTNANSNEFSLREQDRFLPIANVSRIMKKALPGNAKISKDAKETVQECVSEFISFITGEASDKCQREKRKTINGDDLLWAMTTLGFEAYVEPLKVYLQKFREVEGDKVSMVRQGDQSSSSSKDAHVRTLSSPPDGSANNNNTGRYSGGSFSSGIMMMQQPYGQQPQQGGVMYGQHQMMGSYEMPKHINSDGVSTTKET
eukprot:Gb_07866 [translate_table: standard]